MMSINNMAQSILERLRPFVGSKGWDYCVLWKLSEDQRYIELINCCCGGMQNHCGDQVDDFIVSQVIPCRDVMFQHSFTKSCQLLQQLPSSIPLDSGIHAQALISKLPIWLNFSGSSDSSLLEDASTGTQALIPIPGGLVEFFVSKQIAEDQHMIDFLTSQCTLFMEQDMTMMNTSTMISEGNDQNDHLMRMNNYNMPPISPSHGADNLTLPYDDHNVVLDRIRGMCSSQMDFLKQFNYINNEEINKSQEQNLIHDAYNDNFHETNQLDGVQDINALANKVIEEGINDQKEDIKMENGRSDSMSDYSDQMDDDDGCFSKYRRRTKEPAPCKNLVAERKRRKKLNDRLFNLRSLVPNITKLDKASILGDAIAYVKELQKQAKELQDELEENSEDEGAKNNGNVNFNSINPEMLDPNCANNNLIDHLTSSEHAMNININNNGFHGGISKQNHDPEVANYDKGQQMEPQVEVIQVEGKEFFVKVFCEHKSGGFARLMEALDSLGLEVTNVNVTSFRSLVSNVFIVEKKDSELLQAEYVRDSLLELTRNPMRGWSHELVKATEDCNDVDYHHHHHHYHHMNGHHLHN